MKPGLILENELEPIFLGKFPPFPENVKEFLVKYLPYVILFAAFIVLRNILIYFNIRMNGLGDLAFYRGYNFDLTQLFGIILLVLYGLSFNPLRERKKTGWNYFYYTVILIVIEGVIELDFLSSLLTAILGFWVLFQIREKYIF